MALQNPLQKMSKSDINENNYIALLDPPDVVTKKLKRAVTDSGTEIKYQENKPGLTNLLAIYSAITNKAIPELEQEYSGCGYSKFKMDLAEVINEFLRPIQQRYTELRSDDAVLHDILRAGSETAQQLAQPIMAKVHEVIGFL